MGWMVVADVWRGRPFAVELRGARVVGADGGEAIFVDRVTRRRVDISTRHPWRIVSRLRRGPARALAPRHRQDGGPRRSAGRSSSDPCPRERRAAALEPPAPRRGPRPATPSASASASTNASFALRRRPARGDRRRSGLPRLGPRPAARARTRLAGARDAGRPALRPSTCATRTRRAPCCASARAARATVSTTTARFDDVVIARARGRARRAREPHPRGRARRHGPPAARGERRLRERLRPPRSQRPEEPASASSSTRAGTGSPTRPRGSKRPAPPPRGARRDPRWRCLRRACTGQFLALSGTLSLEGPRAGVEATVERASARSRRPRDRSRARAVPARRACSRCSAAASRATCAKVELGAGFRRRRPRDPGRRRHAHCATARIPSPAAPRLSRRGDRAQGGALARRTTRSPHSSPRRRGSSTAALPRRGMSARWAELSAHGALTLEMPARVRGRRRANGRLARDERSRAGARRPPRRRSDRTPASAPRRSTGADRREDHHERGIDRVVGAARDGDPVRRGRGDPRGPARSPARAAGAFAPSTTATILGERFRAPTPR